MFHKMTEERELELARDREAAKAGFRALRRALAIFGAIVALSFAYTTGEMNGVGACLAPLKRESSE